MIVGLRKVEGFGMGGGSKQRGGDSDEAKAEGGAASMATSQWQVQVSNQESLSLHLVVEISEIVTHQEIDVRSKLWPMRAWFACTCPGPSALDGVAPGLGWRDLHVGLTSVPNFPGEQRWLDVVLGQRPKVIGQLQHRCR